MSESPSPTPAVCEPAELRGLIWGVAAAVVVFFWAIPALMANIIGAKFKEILHTLGSEVSVSASLFFGMSWLYSSALGILAVVVVGALLTGGFRLMRGRRSRLGYFVAVGLALALWAALFFFVFPFLAFFAAAAPSRWLD